jgi:anti-anti-sigma factor
MTNSDAMIWKSHPFTIERTTGKSPSTVIIRMCGPFTARDMYGKLTPDELQKVFDLTPMESGAPVELNILDLTEVPYVDSMGLGMIVAHHVRCHHRGIGMVAAGVGARVLQLLKLTRVDRVFPMATTVEEAEAG